MLWWIAATGFHILLLAIGLASATTVTTSYLHIDHSAHLKPVVFLSLILAIMAIFEVIVIYAVFLIYLEKTRVESQSGRNIRSHSTISISAER
jgi:hypothetical protein